MKKLSLLLILLSLNASASRIKFLDSFMISINPEANLVGPIFQNNELSKQNYSSTLLKLILKNAHKKAKRYLEYGDIKAYNTFLILALTIPLHEGLYIHFRDITGDSKKACRKDANSGKTIKSKTAQKHFKAAFLSGNIPFLKSCKKLKRATPYRQMISGGGDGSDIGMMQLSSRWHYDEFLAKEKYKSVDKTLQYGINHAFRGFKRIYSNFSNYPCLINSQNNQVDYKNLIRGTWAGKYNSGNTSVKSTCRFNDTNSNYVGHDIGFSKNLQKILTYPETLLWGYNKNLGFKLSQADESLLKEVISNFKNNTNQRQYLNQILNAK